MTVYKLIQLAKLKMYFEQDAKISVVLCRAVDLKGFKWEGALTSDHLDSLKKIIGASCSSLRDTINCRMMCSPKKIHRVISICQMDRLWLVWSRRSYHVER